MISATSRKCHYFDLYISYVYVKLWILVLWVVTLEDHDLHYHHHEKVKAYISLSTDAFGHKTGGIK
jgi:hypothetical protein